MESGRMDWIVLNLQPRQKTWQNISPSFFFKIVGLHITCPCLDLGSLKIIDKKTAVMFANLKCRFFFHFKDEINVTFIHEICCITYIIIVSALISIFF